MRSRKATAYNILHVYMGMYFWANFLFIFEGNLNRKHEIHLQQAVSNIPLEKYQFHVTHIWQYVWMLAEFVQLK